MKHKILMLTIVSFICSNSCQSNIEDPFENIDSAVFQDDYHGESVSLRKIKQSEDSLNKIIYLQRIASIDEGFSDEEIDFFANISDLCIDSDDNLYVADSKLKKVFKFDKNWNFLLSFGQLGQGPGEFIGRLRIRAGNDGYIYITDDRNFRLYKYSPSGEFIRQFNIARITYDIPEINSLGHIFTLSINGYYIIDCLDNDFGYRKSLVDIKYHLTFPLIKPTRLLTNRFYKRPPRSNEILRAMSPNDHLVVVINNSQYVMCFDINNRLI